MLEELKKRYEEMQTKYGDPSLDAITFGGCTENPEICFVFMNPTGRNITADKSWTGIKSPWIGTKNIWYLFQELKVIDQKTYEEIKKRKGKDWTPEFAEKVYKQVADNKVFITNLAKCTQIDARPLTDEIYKQYLDLFWQEIEYVKPKKIILFGNQVSSIVLEDKISVSKVRRQKFVKKDFSCYPVFYPVGNGFSNIDKSIEDIKYIRKQG